MREFEKTAIAIAWRIFLLAVCIVVVLGAINYGLPRLTHRHAPKKQPQLQLSDTREVLTQVRRINQFTTAYYCEDVVMHYTKRGSQKPFLGRIRGAQDELVLICQGTVTAGFDLSSPPESNLYVQSDTLTLYLPEAEVIDVLMNPSQTEYYVEKGKWDYNSQVQPILTEARRRLEQHAIDNGLIEKANSEGIDQLYHLFHSFGFRVINITVESPTITPTIEAPAPIPADTIPLS